MRPERRGDVERVVTAVCMLEKNTSGQAWAGAAGAAPALAKNERGDANGADPVAATPGATEESTEISPEIRAVIEATLAACLGHKIQIRSVRLLEAPEAAMAWARQGRMAIQSSHNPRAARG